MKNKLLGFFLIIGVSIISIFGLTSCDLEGIFNKCSKLAEPVVVLEDDTASWQEIENASNYEIDIDGAIVTVEKTVISKKMELGQSLKVRAIGDGVKFISSDWSNTVTYELSGDDNPQLVKLPTPTVSLSAAGIANFEAIDGATGYQYVVDGVVQTTSELNVQLTNGQSFKVKALGDGITTSDSDYSNEVTYILGATSIKDLVEGNEYTVCGTVAAVNAQSFVLSDETASVLVYLGSSWNSDVVVGDRVSVTGTTSIYGKAIQFGTSSTYTVLGKNNISYPDAEEVNINFITNATQEEALAPVYVVLKGTLSISNGRYYNVSTAVNGVYGSISYPKEDLSKFDGKDIVVEGYFTGVTGSNAYLNICATKVYEYTTGLKIQDEYAGLKAGTITEHTVWTFTGEVVDMTATVFNNTYGTYNVKLIVDIEGVLVGVYNGQVNSQYPSSIPNLAVGTQLTVTGTIAENYTMSSGNYTVSIEFSYPEISWDDTSVGTTDVKFVMINDTHGALTDSSSSVSIGRVDTLYNELESANGQYIKIHNGDAFQGSYVVGAKYGLPLLEALNVMDFDCFVLGNHEFDWGIDKIAAYKDGNYTNGEANFPFLGANIYYAGTTTRPNWIDAYKVIEYGDIKVGVIGVIGADQESDILTRYVEDYNFVDPVNLIKQYASQLRTQEGCEVVVVATHNYDENLNSRIAQLSGDSIIDSIFCAHTHQRINTSVARADGVNIPVVQNTHKNNLTTEVILELNDNLSLASYRVNQINPSNYVISNDVQKVIDNYSDLIEDSLASLGKTTSSISKSTLGRYATEAMLDYEYCEASFDGKIDLAIINTGGVRATIDSGTITKADVFEVFPFNNMVVLVNLDGASLKKVYNSNSEYLYLGVADEIGSISSLKDTTIYQLAIIDYVFESTYSSYDVFDRLDSSQFIETDIIMRDILIEYIDALY